MSSEVFAAEDAEQLAAATHTELMLSHVLHVAQLSKDTNHFMYAFALSVLCVIPTLIILLIAVNIGGAC